MLMSVCAVQSHASLPERQAEDADVLKRERETGKVGDNEGSSGGKIKVFKCFKQLFEC